MGISTSAIVPFYLISFVLLSFQYFRLNPDRRLLNVHFGLMLGAIILMLVQILLPRPLLSVALFLTALVWLGVAIYLFRQLPPPR
jgi:hypothetical protein